MLGRVEAAGDSELRRWMEGATVATEPWTAPDDATAPRRAAELPNLRSGDLRADVEACIARVERAGHEVIVLDQSRPDVDLAVVKVVAPGLRHFWRRLAPGRLFDVPVELGWVERRLDEDELNPWSMFL
jgi:ribosomal protein S12 methylthiotransferase accessory factor